MAVMAAVNAAKYGNQNAPWGVVVPRKSTTGKCQAPHSSPSKIAGANALFLLILGNAYPIQPISSKNPAGTLNKMPMRKQLGAKTVETNDFKEKSTVRIKPGGMKSATYQCVPSRTLRIREKRSLKPLFPSTILVRTIPATLGPRSMAGNISSPSSLGTASPRISFGAATKNAPVQEIAYVSTK